MMSTFGGLVQMEGVLLRSNTEYKSPLDPELWHAWQVASKDPDLCLQQFIREGVPLGMSSKIPPSGGSFRRLGTKRSSPWRRKWSSRSVKKR